MNKIAHIKFATLLALSSLNLAGKTAPETLDEITVSENGFSGLHFSGSETLDAESLTGRQVNSLKDLNGLSTNLNVSANGIGSFGDVLTLRGIGNTQFFGSPGVQTYLDGVPLGSAFSYESELYDLKAVEISRGPQGSRFGKLAPGGAINLITRPPTKSGWTELSASYASFSYQKYLLSSSAFLNEEFSYSLATLKSSSEGFLNNHAGKDNDSDSLCARLAFHWDGGTGTKAVLGGDFSSHDLGAQPLVLRDGGDFYDRSTNFEESTNIDRNQQFFKFDQETDWGNLAFTTSRNNWEMDPNKLDIDLSTNSAATSTIVQDENEWGQEIRATSEPNDSLKWSIGASFYSTDLTGSASRWYLFPYPENTLVANLGPTATLTPNANWGNATEATTYSIDRKNHGFFGSLGKDIDSRNSIEIGLRYDLFKTRMNRDKRSEYGAFTFTNSINPNLPADIPIPASNLDAAPLRLSKESTLLSPSLLWRHTHSETLSSFYQASMTGKPAGFSAFTDSETNASFAKEEILSHEIGFQNDFNDAWNFSLSVFYNYAKNYQMELPEPGSTNYSVLNLDRAIMYGAEIETALKLDGGWSISLGYGLSESEIRNVSALATKSSALANLRGKPLSFVPQYCLSSMIRHDLDKGLFYQIGTRTIGDSYFWDQTASNDTDKINSYTLLDARIGFEINQWKINLWGSNLTDKEFHTSLVSSLSNLGAAPGVAGSPRAIGLTLSKAF